MVERKEYWYITDKGSIGKDIDYNSKRDKYRKLIGNFYTNYKECKETLDSSLQKLDRVQIL